MTTKTNERMGIRTTAEGLRATEPDCTHPGCATEKKSAIGSGMKALHPDCSHPGCTDEKKKVPQTGMTALHPDCRHPGCPTTAPVGKATGLRV